jgi:hypothetical protein
MSMNANYRALSSRLAERVRENPTLVRAVIDAGDGDPRYPDLPQLRSLLDALSREVTERFGSIPEMHADLQAQLAAAAATDGEAADTAAEALSDAGFTLSDIRDGLDIGKAWHGLHYLLATTIWEPTATAAAGGFVLGKGSECEWLLDAFELVRTYVASASARGDSLLLYVV